MISVVIPTLNPGPRLGAVLAALVEGAVEGLVKEVVVADGGSTDATLALAEEAGCVVIPTRPGRGVQLRAGCAAARADWVLALHADSVVQAGWVEAVGRHIAGAEDRAGYFSLRFDDPSLTARIWEQGVALRSRLLRLPYGDQGLLVHRNLYDAVGGYPDWPLMEDVGLVQRIGAARLRALGATVRTSAERYRRDGWLRRSLRNAGLMARFSLGADPHDLARRYG